MHEGSSLLGSHGMGIVKVTTEIEHIVLSSKYNMFCCMLEGTY